MPLLIPKNFKKLLTLVWGTWGCLNLGFVEEFVHVLNICSHERQRTSYS